MRKLLLASAIVTLFASCQKEASFNPGNDGGTGSGTGTGSTSGLLVKTVAVTGSETQTTAYTYDSQNRLETMKITGVSGGIPINSFHKYVRDNAGRIIKVLQKADAMPMPGASTDTSVKTFHYPNATTMNYDYSVHVITMNVGGISMSTIDSAVYNYSGSKMTSYNQYMFSSVMPGSVMMNSKYEFIYDASDRVTNMKMYSDGGVQGGPMDLDMEWKYTYGTSSMNNVYAASSAAQNLAMHGLPNTTAHFISKMEANSNATSPPVNIVITTTYVNGAGNKPASGTVVTATAGQPTRTTNYTFFYQ
jgi:hypothetical protein